MSDVNGLELMRPYGTVSINHQFEFIGEELPVVAKFVRGNSEVHMGFLRFHPLKNVVIDGLMYLDHAEGNIRYKRVAGGGIEAIGYKRKYLNDVIHIHSDRELKYFVMANKGLIDSGAIIRNDDVTPENYDRYQDIDEAWQEAKRVKEENELNAAQEKAEKIKHIKELLRLAELDS